MKEQEREREKDRQKMRECTDVQQKIQTPSTLSSFPNFPGPRKIQGQEKWIQTQISSHFSGCHHRACVSAIPGVYAGIREHERKESFICSSACQGSIAEPHGFTPLLNLMPSLHCWTSWLLHCPSSRRTVKCLCYIPRIWLELVSLGKGCWQWGTWEDRFRNLQTWKGDWSLDLQ